MAAVRTLVRLGYSPDQVAAALERPNPTIAERAFLKKYSGAPIDEGQLMEAAMDVEGEIGAAARNLSDSRVRLDAALEAIGFEHG